MTDKNEKQGSASEPGETGTSVFDLFEPPPKKDPNSFGRIPVIKDGEIDLTDSSAEVKAAADAEAAGLQHWTAPATGQVPAILSGEGDEAGMWGDVKGPSWHGEDPSWDGPDLADVFANTDAVSIERNLIDLDDDDDEGDYQDEFDAPAVQRPARVVGSVPPDANADQDRTESPLNADLRRPAPAQPVASHRQSGAPQNPPQEVPAVTDHGHAPQAPPRPTPAPNPAGSVPAPPDVRSVAPPERVDAVDQTRLEAERPVAPPASVLDQVPVKRTAPPPPIRAGAPKHPRSGEPNIDDIRFADGEPFAGEPSVINQTPARASLEREGSVRQDYQQEPSFRFDPGADRGYDDDTGYDPDYDDDPGYDEDYDDEAIGLGQIGGRNLPKAISVGLGLAAIVLAAMYFGPYPTLLLIVVLALLAVLELYNAMRVAGLRPATLLGIVGTVAAPAAAYLRGDAAFPLIVALAVVFGTLWYLVGADTERPVLNLSLTMMGIFWVGGLSAFAALMIREDLGIQLLLATIIITVASDTLAYIGGRAYGSRPFHHASPNKTWEGTITGFVGAVFAGFAIGVTEMGSLWDGRLVPAMALGAVVGCLAPMGDLAESVVKRDLGVKDMGTLLPGHGGVLDRLDALLFALPGAYYLALVYGLF